MELLVFYLFMGPIDLVEPPKEVLRRLLLKHLAKLKPTGKELRRINRAFDISFEGHRNAPLRASGEAYIFHIIRAVFEAIDIMYEFEMRDIELLVQLILHDSVEDAPEAGMNPFLMRTNIFLKMGFETAQGVHYLTKHTIFGVERENSLDELIECGLWRPQGGKFPDRSDNMRTLWAMPRVKQIKKIEETEKYFLRLRNAMFENLYKEFERGRIAPFQLHLPGILYTRLMELVARERLRLEAEQNRDPS